MTVEPPEPLAAHFDDVVWEQIGDTPSDDAMRWKTLVGGCDGKTKHLTFGICEFPPGTRLRPHHHSDAEIYYVTAGIGDVLLDDTVIPVRPGSVIYVPDDMVHGIRNTGTQTLSLIYVFPTDKWSDVTYHMVDRTF